MPSSTGLPGKRRTLSRLSDDAYAYTAEGDPNAGVIVGRDAALVIDTAPTPVAAEAMIAAIREVTAVPIRFVLLSHYHAVRTLGAPAFLRAGAAAIVASGGTAELIEERGAEDMRSEIERFPRLFEPAGSIEGLTRPTLVFDSRLSLDLGGLVVELLTLGRGHTRGDAIAWIPSQGVCFSGDLVEQAAGVYAGDAYLADWLGTLDRLRALSPDKMVPGRGPALTDARACNEAMDYTSRWVGELLTAARSGVARGDDLRAVYQEARRVMDPLFGHVFVYEHCMPFDVSRAFDEASGIEHPRVWTAKRDAALRRSLQS